MIQDDNKRSHSPAEKAENPKVAYCVHCESLTIAVDDESGYELCGKCKCALPFGEDYDRSLVCLIEDLSHAVGFCKTLELVAQCVELNTENDTNRAQTW